MYRHAVPYFSPHLVVVESSIKRVPRLRPLPRADLSRDNGRPVLTVRFEVMDSQWPSPMDLRERWHRWGFCWTHSREPTVYFEYRLGLFRYRLLVSGLHTTEPRVFANRTYVRHQFVRIGSLQTIYNHLTDLITVKLIEHGYLPLHAACIVSSRGSSALICAPPETGKTTTALLAREEGYQLVSDDITVTDGLNSMPGFMEGVRVYSYAFLARSTALKDRLRRSALWLIYQLGLGAYAGLVLPVGGIRVRKVFGDSARITHLLFLSHGPNPMATPIDRSNAKKFMWALQRAEFCWSSNPILQCFDYFHGLLRLQSVEERENALLDTLIRNSSGIFLVEAPHPAAFLGVIKGIFPPA